MDEIQQHDNSGLEFVVKIRPMVKLVPSDGGTVVYVSLFWKAKIKELLHNGYKLIGCEGSTRIEQNVSDK